MMPQQTRCALIIVIFVLLSAGPSTSVYGQANEGIGFTQLTRPVADITNPDTIEFLLDQLIIPTDSVESLQVVDLTGNGYGADDVIITQPTGNTYPLSRDIMTDQVESMMNQWVLESEFQEDTGLLPAEAFKPDSLTSRPAESEIMYELLRAVERNYNDTPISLLLERDQQGITVQMWDYNPNAMQYQPPPSGPPDTLQTRDLLYIVRSDSILYDVVYINRSIEQTEYIPEGGPTSFRQPTPSGASNTGSSETASEAEPNEEPRRNE
jgi:hypothetical protein